MRQLRLRDIGGIIVIDFIDMASPKNRAAVEKALGEELERDRTKTYVVEISPLGLVEMTRQNVTDGPREVMTKKCPTCGGDGIVVSEHTAAVDVERRLRGARHARARARRRSGSRSARRSRGSSSGSGGARLRELEETTKRRFFLVGKEGEHLDHFKVLDQGTLEKLAPKVPVEVGQERRGEARRGRVARPARRSRQDRRHRRRRRRRREARREEGDARVITALADGLAWAELLTPAEDADEPLTAEGEAERPTRVEEEHRRPEEEDGRGAVVEDERVRGGRRARGDDERRRQRDGRRERDEPRRGEEADAPRLARRPEPQAEDGDGDAGPRAWRPRRRRSRSRGG